MIRSSSRALLLGVVVAASLATIPVAARAAGAPVDFTAAAARIDRSVVGVGPVDANSQRNRGAGFVLPGGRVVTAAHVVAGVDEVRLRLPDGRQTPARVIGRDELSDVALLRTSADLVPATPAPAGSLRRGAPVAAVGDPLGFSATLTVGHVSTPARPWGETSPWDLVQHDAALNPGSSGGPLVDAEGRVVAMNVAIADGARRHVGIGLALPIEVVTAIAERLAREGDIPRPRLGLRLRATEALGPAADLPAGVVIEAVEPGSPAVDAGLTAGEVVTAVDGTPVASARDLARLLEPKRPGDTLRLTLRDTGAGRHVSLALAAPPRPPTEAVAETSPLGLAMEAAPSRRIAAVSPDGAAEAAGLAAGDEVLAIAGRRVGEGDAAERLRAVEASARPGGVALLVARGDKTRWVVIGPNGRLDCEAPFGSNAEALSSHSF